MHCKQCFYEVNYNEVFDKKYKNMSKCHIMIEVSQSDTHHHFNF